MAVLAIAITADICSHLFLRANDADKLAAAESAIGMTDNSFLRDHRARVSGAILRAQSLGIEGHDGVRGKLKEILVRKILGPVMPPEVKLGTGLLVSVDGSLSGQVDVILYSPAIVPPALFDQAEGYFPIESALYTIEVKSRIDASEIKKSISAAKVIRSLPQIATEHAYPTFDQRIVVSKVGPTPLAINALFAFGSDLESDPENELRRYRKYDQNADSAPALTVICIVGRGYWYFSERWKFSPADANHSEIMTWLSGTVNTMPGFIVAKGRPRFGNYLALNSTIIDAT